MKTTIKKMNKHAINIALAIALVGSVNSQMVYAEGFTEALTSGKGGVNLNLRYESVDQDNALADASALTLRTLLALSLYTSPSPRDRTRSRMPSSA